MIFCFQKGYVVTLVVKWFCRCQMLNHETRCDKSALLFSSASFPETADSGRPDKCPGGVAFAMKCHLFCCPGHPSPQKGTRPRGQT